MEYPSVQILGLRFFVGSAAAAAELITANGGLLVVPAAPALVKLEHDEIYRRAMTSADVAIPDSGLMVLLWQIFHRRSVPRISGLAYLKALMESEPLKDAVFVLPNEAAKQKLLAWDSGFNPGNCYVAPMYDASAHPSRRGPAKVEDRHLLALIEDRHPAHVLVAIGNGPQEKLGYFLRENLSYRPAIHCIGAALGFVTGEQVAIPNWADRFYFGWLFRLIAQPKIFVPRLTRALKLPWLIFKYGEHLPPLQRHG